MYGSHVGRLVLTLLKALKLEKLQFAQVLVNAADLGRLVTWDPVFLSTECPILTAIYPCLTQTSQINMPKGRSKRKSKSVDGRLCSCCSLMDSSRELTEIALLLYYYNMRSSYQSHQATVPFWTQAQKFICKHSNLQEFVAPLEQSKSFYIGKRPEF